MKPNKVLVVCHGNINRSQLFACVLKGLRTDLEIREASLASLQEGWKSQRTAKRTRNFAETELGVKLDHKSNKFTLADAEWADKIVYFDNGNYKRLMQAVPQLEPKFVNAGSLIGQSKIADPNYISDPTLLKETMQQIVAAAKVAADEWK